MRTMALRAVGMDNDVMDNTCSFRLSHAPEKIEPNMQDNRSRNIIGIDSDIIKAECPATAPLSFAAKCLCRCNRQPSQSHFFNH